MIAAGVDVVRLNFSHGTPADHIARAELVREIARALERTVGIMVRPAGPEDPRRQVRERQDHAQHGRDVRARRRLRDRRPGRVGLDYKELPRDVRAGAMLLLDDGRIVLDVQDVQRQPRSPPTVRARRRCCRTTRASTARAAA